MYVCNWYFGHMGGLLFSIFLDGLGDFKVGIFVYLL